MTKVKVLGDAMVVTSGLRAEDIKKISKQQPASLKLYDEETKDEVFAIGFAETASVTEHGVCFDGTNAEGNAIATIKLPAGMDAEKKTKYITEKYGTVLGNLNFAEERISLKIEEFNTNMAEVANNIEIVE